MENNQPTKDSSKANDLPNLKIYFGLILVTAVIVSLVTGVYIGKSSNSSQDNNDKVLGSNLNQASTAPTPTFTPEPTAFIISEVQEEDNQTSVVLDSKICSKYGFAQKWEFLTSYTVKEGDSIVKIAKEQLKDESRVNEILKINGVGPLVAGYTLYLPPASIPKSSGNLKQIYGKLTSKSTASWNVLLDADPKGQSILIPSFLFNKINNKDAFNINDCVRVFLDDGFEVYSIDLQ